MKFCEYFEIIKANYAKRISIDDLCLKLFDSVIQPLELTNSEDDYLYYGKPRLYEFASGKRPAPSKIRDNVYEPKVVSSIAEYFEKNIVPELVPHREDICYQIMRLVENDETISPATKANLEMIAKPETVALLLAQTFGYAIRNDLGISFGNELDCKRNVRTSKLYLMGIEGTSLVTDTFFVEQFKPFSDDFINSSRIKVEELYNCISDIHLSEQSTNPYIWKGWLTTAINIEPIKIPLKEQVYITNMANSLNIDLPKDFFSLGDLHRNPMKSVYLLAGGSDLEGSQDAHDKYILFKTLLDELNTINKWIPIKECFSLLYCIKLALINVGNIPDEDIIITLEAEEGSVLMPTDLLQFDRLMLNDLLDEVNAYKFFGIPASKNYFEYSDSRDFSKRPNRKITPYIHMYDNEVRTIEVIKKEFEDVFDYQFIKEDGKIYVSLKCDKIMHNTAIAFPTVLFVSEDIEELKYTIRSKNMEFYYSGVITRI